MSENPMTKVRLEKVTLNMGAGEPGPKLENCKKMLEAISGKEIVTTSTHKRSTFGPGGRQIGVKVTFRGNEAMEILKRMLHAVENKIKPDQFDKTGNFSFGVAEYINIPGTSYDPDIGMLGLDVSVTLTKPGFRVKKRKIRPSKIGKSQLITKEEAIEFAEKKLGINVTEVEE